MAPMGSNFEARQCRWAAYRGDEVERSPRFNNLPLDEQVSRGQEILQMLQATQKGLRPQLGAVEAEEREAEEHQLSQPDASSEVKMIVRHTFIELVASPTRRLRSRALSDSVLSGTQLGEKVQEAEVMSTVIAELSDISTDAPSDLEDNAAVVASTGASASDAASLPPVQQPVEFDSCHWPQVEEAYGMSAASGDMGGVEQLMPMAWMGMPSDMWMPMGYDMSGMLPCHSMACDPLMPWQWVGDCTEAAAGDLQPSSTEDASGIVDFEVPLQCTDNQGEAEPVPKTTVMLRNLPTSYTRVALLELLEDEGFDGTFDFVYLPMDFGSKTCLGYAFVNFVSASDADRCWQVFAGFTDWGVDTDKVCEVTWGDPYQGLQAHVERYQNSPVMHNSVPDEWKPIVLVAGVRVAFPAPTKTISAPKMRRRNADKGQRA
mmetsp:Transcript_95526/g.270028  ORF Transcript_95526/g.270028 Transcript_95526/m.270028 type:complete len:432 (+) Transcript_95526:84-1379(+)